MPRIPLSEGPGLIRHVRDSVPMRGAPGMDFNMEQGRALSRLGEQIADAGRDIGESGMRIADARARFLEAQQASTDKLMASEARNWYKTLNAELSQRMAENPNEYEHFAEWARETDEKYAEGAKTWTDKMSAKYREQFESEMQGIRIENWKERSLLGIHAKVTNDYNLFQARFKDFAERGDYEEAKRLLDEHRGVLISEAEYQQKLLDYHRLADFGAAKRAVEAGDASIIEKLQERDEQGNYKNYTHLEEGRRGQLLNKAIADDAKRRADENQTLLDRLNSGEQVSQQEIERAFEGKSSPGDTKQKNQQIAIVKRFDAARKAAERQAQIERRREQREIDAAEREKRREAREAAQQEKKKKQDAVNLLEYQILAHEFPTDPGRRQIEYAEVRNKIFTEYAGDGESVKRLMTQLDESVKAVENPHASYKKTWNYQYGKSLLKQREGNFYSRYPGRGESWYSFVTNVYNDDKDLKASNYAMAEIQFDAFMKQNPNANEAQIEAFLDQLQKSVNWTECDKLMQFWGSYRVPNLFTPQSVAVGTEINGWKFKGGDPSNGKNWEKNGQPGGQPEAKAEEPKPEAKPEAKAESGTAERDPRTRNKQAAESWRNQ